MDFWKRVLGYWKQYQNSQKFNRTFYTNGQHLIYTETVEGVVVNVKKKKTLMKLKNVLDKVVYALKKNGKVKDTGELVAVLRRKK